MMFHRFSSFVFTTFVLVAGATVGQAAIIELYTENLDAFDAAQDLGDGTTYAVETVNPSVFGTGNAIRLYDESATRKPELQGDLAAPLFEPFRIDFQSFDQSPSPSSHAVRFRMANGGTSISSESNSAFSVSWQADAELTAKYNGSADSNTGDVDTISSDALVGVQDVTIVANGFLADSYSYSLFGQSRTLNALSYDIYINGVLLNDSPDSDFANGMLFHYESSGGYDETLGIQRFGLIGSSNSAVGFDIMYDNIILRTGDDIAPIPEPTSLMLVVVGLGLLVTQRRLRR